MGWVSSGGGGQPGCRGVGLSDVRAEGVRAPARGEARVCAVERYCSHIKNQLTGRRYSLPPAFQIDLRSPRLSTHTHVRRRAACVPCTALRARARAHARTLSPRSRTPSAREGRSPLPPCAAPTPILTVRSRFTGRPGHVSSTALTGRLAKQALACGHEWVGAASASTSLPLVPATALALGAPVPRTVGRGCLGAGPAGALYTS